MPNGIDMVRGLRVFWISFENLNEFATKDFFACCEVRNDGNAEARANGAFDRAQGCSSSPMAPDSSHQMAANPAVNAKPQSPMVAERLT